jgi:hypothetical protein
MNTNGAKATSAKFEPGTVVATPAALKAIREAGQSAHELLARHLSGDWGDVCADDSTSNDEALIDGSRLLSAYTLRCGVRIWIITEAEGDDGRRAATTLLLPNEN